PYVLSDIADAEDFAGDMDFKITGTSEGITAIQMDMKVHGLPVEILKQAIDGAKPGRAHILAHMLETIAAPREALSPYAPRIEKVKINPEKIGAVIGKGGEVINRITLETGADIDIKDDGLITVSAADTASIEKAIDWIKSLTEEPEIGRIYEGKVVSIKDFGAFINILPGLDGMVHISELADHRVERVEDVLTEGQTVKVKLMGIDERGRLSLSLKAIDK
ncbi:S1 RNA-binding domain-containing protein, partial [Candidatus Saccharibacteria bacterium]|nr:S1 RNA-binding domain-containing protein [Candidatus Saccharibacteria bacterium]